MGLEQWAVFSVIFCLGYIVGSYQRNSTKLQFYRLGANEAIVAVRQEMLAAQQLQQQQQEQEVTTDKKQPMGFHKPPVKDLEK